MAVQKSQVRVRNRTAIAHSAAEGGSGHGRDDGKALQLRGPTSTWGNARIANRADAALQAAGSRDQPSSIMPTQTYSPAETGYI